MVLFLACEGPGRESCPGNSCEGPAFVSQGNGQAALCSPLQGRVELPSFVFLACSMALLSQRRLCWICFSKSDSYLISTSELSASIPRSQPHCHRLWCKKEFRFPEHGQRLHSSIQVGGVRRGFPHPLSNVCQAWAWSGTGLWCREKPRLHRAMPPPRDAAGQDEDQPRACPGPLLFFPCSLCGGAGKMTLRACGVPPRCTIPTLGWV